LQLQAELVSYATLVFVYTRTDLSILIIFNLHTTECKNIE